MNNKLIKAAAAAIVATAALPARADTVIFTTTGTIGAGVDELGLFGVRGAQLDGQAFSLSISIDLDGLVQHPSTWSGYGTINEAIQDPSRPTPVTGQVSVGGGNYAWTIDDALLARVTLATAGASSMDRPDIASVNGYGVTNEGLRVSATNELHTSSKGNLTFVGDTRFDQQRSFDPAMTLMLSSSLFHASLGPGEGANTSTHTLITSFSSTGPLSTATWSSVSPVPEPEQAWMLAAGVGLIGWGMRRRCQA